MKWSVKKVNKNDFITLEGVNIKTKDTEIEVKDENKSVIRAIKNTLARLKREKRIEVVSGEVPEKAVSAYSKKTKANKEASAAAPTASVTAAPVAAERSAAPAANPKETRNADPVKPKAAKPAAGTEGPAASAGEATQ